MSDQIASTPLEGPTRYDFGAGTPETWPQGYYVPEADYDAIAAEMADQSDRRKQFAADLIDAKSRVRELEAELKASQEVAEHRLCARTLLERVNDWFYPPDRDVPEEAALLVEIHRFLEGCFCPPNVPQHLDGCCGSTAQRHGEQK